jgi:hypothetical protein
MQQQLHLSVPVLVAFIVAFVAQFTRIFSATKPFWGRAPVWVQAWLPPLLPAVTALGAGVTGAQTWTDVAVAFLGAAALLLPGAPSNRTASAALLCLVMGLGFASSACGLFGSGGALAPVAGCAPVPEQVETDVVFILMLGGDYMTALESYGLQKGVAVVRCAVQAYLDKLPSGKLGASADEAAAKDRGRAYLASKAAK